MAPKIKTAPSNGSAPKGKPAKASPSTSGTSTPVVATPHEDLAKAALVTGHGRPDKGTYDAEQEKLKKEIDALQIKLSAVRDKIGLGTKSGSGGGGGNDRRNQLRAELDAIRGQQGNTKAARGKVFDQLKALQEGIQKKGKDLQAARGKVPFKTTADLDAHVKNLEKQIESGSMKLADEKRALQEISQLRRSRRAIEGFQAEQEAIEKDRATADELRKQLDDPEAKAISERYDAIKSQLDELKKEEDEAYANRNKLFDERNAIQAELDGLYAQKRESAQNFREANDHYWQKVNEDRARRAEKARAQRAADEDAKKEQIVERLREEASIPAFQAQIEDCQTLIDNLSGKSTALPSAGSLLASKGDVAGVPKLELRKVDGAGEGLVVRKKKGEDEEAYFTGGGKGKGKGKKGSSKSAVPSESDGTGSSSNHLNIPLATLSALLSLSIPPPASPAEIPRVIEDLKTKKSWFEANQARVTSENIAKAEAEIKRLTGKHDSKTEAPSPSQEITPLNGGGEVPAEPAPTPKVSDVPATAVSTDDVVERLESVQEYQDASDSQE
ncbi:hypothetical protein JAAARDRAFT_683996 [Jaapia argillacea MUCL 33604]|uniref:Nuclear segregation protein Bfr1 n=1 Tax=Jaapia argillacea MUCL 33604 TaxID=933084 RepID=A0A067QEC9_9AGAM|nr:hypothetical protein JAAARDRAFT_683996 [Jaapia argillacea MUCL 33604]